MKKCFWRHLPVFAGILTLCLGMLTGCGNSVSSGESTAESISTADNASEAEIPDSETLVYGCSTFTRINPILDEAGEICDLLFDGLTSHGEDGSIKTGLAEKWEWDEDALTWTFYLRKDVVWHDGEPFTAADVKFTMEAIENPDSGSEIASDFEEVEEVTVVDDYTVTMELSQPNAAFLDYMTVPILPKHLLLGRDMETDLFFQQPVGTGPYQFVSWDENDRITMVKNDSYYRGTPGIPQIVFQMVGDDTERAQKLSAGELDLTQLTAKDASSLEEDVSAVIYDKKTAGYRGIQYNFANSFWREDKDILPAISYALDRDAMVQDVLLAEGSVAYSPIQCTDFYDETASHYDWDPEKTAQILQNAGWEKGEDGIWAKDEKKLSFTLNVLEGDQVSADLAQLASDQLQAAGIDMQISTVSEYDWVNQDACMMTLGSAYDADCGTFKVYKTAEGENRNYYSNIDVDSALNKARHTENTDKRKAYYAEFEEALMTNPSCTFLCYTDTLFVSKVELEGISEDILLGKDGTGLFWNVKDWMMTKKK